MTAPHRLHKTELLERIETGWQAFNQAIDRLSVEQLTGPTDAAGWTVKDHLIHIAFWEDGIVALLNGLTRAQFTGIDEGTWESVAEADIDRLNAVIQRRFQDVPMPVFRRMHADIHAQLLHKLDTLDESDLYRPYTAFQTGMTWQGPVIDWIVGNSYGHYEEHLPWMNAIAAAAQASVI